MYLDARLARGAAAQLLTSLLDSGLFDAHAATLQAQALTFHADAQAFGVLEVGVVAQPGGAVLASAAAHILPAEDPATPRGRGFLALQARAHACVCSAVCARS